MNRLVLTVIIFIFSGIAQAKYLVLGGGPAGLYMAYSLLLNDVDAEVELYEGRDFIRPQVIRVPFKFTERLSAEMIKDLWPDEGTRHRIFKPGKISDANFWPKPDYSYWPFNNVGDFQNIMLNTLKKNKNFKHIASHMSVDELVLLAKDIDTNIQGIFIATGPGQFTTDLRHELLMAEGKKREHKGHGIYLIYRNQSLESYEQLKSSELGADGLTYAASNNRQKDVQIYTYPAAQGPLKEVYDELKGDVAREFMGRAGFKQYLSNPLSLDDEFLGLEQSEGSLWFKKFKDAVVELSQKHKVPLPENLADVKVIYAERSEYHWQKVSMRFNNKVPLYFVGDASGGTDYKLGLSLGRGLLAVDELTSLMKKNPKDSVDTFQHYWDKVISSEFGKGPDLSGECFIKFKYLIQGRKIGGLKFFPWLVYRPLGG